MLSNYRMLKCLIVPLIVASITSAIGSLDLSMSGRIASRYVSIFTLYNKLFDQILFFRSILFYMTTTICAVVLGIILVVTIRPGDGAFKPASAKPTTTRPLVTADTLLDLVR